MNRTFLPGVLTSIAIGLLTLVVAPPLVGQTGRLVNLSIRTGAGAGAETLIVGFVAEGGTANASLLVRAAGPALLPYGVTGVLADPQLAINNSVPVVVQGNNDWAAALADTFAQVGAFAWTVGSKDAAVALDLPPAPYTVHVTGTGGGTGIVLAEIYDVNTTFAATKPKLINVSARSQVGTDASIMIAGIVIGGNSAQRVLIRAVGPTLASYGVTGVLANPLLAIFEGQAQIGGNDDWPAPLAATFAQVGAFPLNASSKDAAFVVTLNPGVYTAQVSGVGGTTGVALVEIYAAPASADFVLIPAGTFTMGSVVTSNTADPRDGMSDATPHTVTLAAFYLAKTETTWTEWLTVRAWAVTHGYPDLASVGAGKDYTHPVQSVNWHEVVKWLNAKSEKEGLVPVYYTDNAQTTVYRTGSVNVTNAQVKWSANGYRLPTEAEWEYAARGGLAGRRFPWGDTISHTQANYSSSVAYAYDVSPTRGYHPTYATGAFPYTSPAGSFAVNGYGLSDMTGNVWEWCWDWYAGYGSAAVTAPHGPVSGTDRVGRGGGWDGNASEDRLAVRGFGDPGGRSTHLGFRPARTFIP